MIADLDATIRQLLADELPIADGEIDIAFQQPKREWSARLSRPAVNCYLYDVRENAQLRVHQWEAATNTPGNGAGPNQAVRKRSPLYVDCAYLLTAWAFDPGDEHRLLTRCLLALARLPVLPATRLRGDLRSVSHEVRTRVAGHDRLPSGAELWGALDNELRPSITYVVTLALEPWAPVTGPAVHTFHLSAGPLGGDSGAADDEPRYIIGGTLRDAALEGAPVAGAKVTIDGTDLHTRTDADGRFRFSGLTPGAYRLAAAGAGLVAVKHDITVPAPAGAAYDIAVRREPNAPPGQPVCE